MTRLVRWSLAATGSVVTFGLSLWLARDAPFGWMPRAQADRWVVAAAFATVVAGAVGAAVSWWAGREAPSSAEPVVRRVSQRATASDRARSTQVGGSQNGPSAQGGPVGGEGGSETFQHAEASGEAVIIQVGADQRSTRRENGGRPRRS